MGAGVKVDGDLDAAQVAGVDIRGVGADQDRLADDGGALANDQAAAMAVVRTADLAPLAAAVKLRLAELEQDVVARGLHLFVVLDGARTPLELRFALGRTHELDFQALGGEQTLVPGYQPGKREDGASGDIVDDLFWQRLPRGRLWRDSTLRMAEK